jgi:hypothetical protein
MNEKTSTERLFGQLMLERFTFGTFGKDEVVLDAFATVVGTRSAAKVLNDVRRSPGRLSTAQQLIRYNINPSRP